MTSSEKALTTARALRNIALGLDPDAAREVMEAAELIERQAEATREAEARYTVLLLDLLGNDDITISRASELTRISVAAIRRWSRDTFKTGQQTTFPFPAKDQR